MKVRVGKLGMVNEEEEDDDDDELDVSCISGSTFGQSVSIV